MDDTVAVTQNFMSKGNSSRVWKSLRQERPKLAKHFFELMKDKHPDLYEQMVTANAEDKFKMLHLRKKWGDENKFADDISTDSYCCSSTSSESDSEAEDSDGGGDSSSDDDSSKSEKSIHGPNTNNLGM